jgi:hypothetical protein
MGKEIGGSHSDPARKRICSYRNSLKKPPLPVRRAVTHTTHARKLVRENHSEENVEKLNI